MTLKITFVGAEANEQTPQVAVYTVDRAGRIGKKIGSVEKGNLAAADTLSGTVAFGPDVPDPASLDPKSLLIVRAADQRPVWQRNSAINIPAQWWRNWLSFLICLSGKASRCFPFVIDDPIATLRENVLGRRADFRFPFPPFCSPLCNGIVEIWESTCCCWPILISQVAGIIANLEKFLAENPVMFPPIPQPDPGPIDRALEQSVNQALAAGKVNTSFAPSTELAQHLENIKNVPAQQALDYIEINPALWPFFCFCTSAKLGETVLNPDGTFTFCYWQYPFLFNCRRSYFYKVKQFINGQWTYVYDGAAAHQYFNANQFANLNTFFGLTCHQPPPPPGNDIVALQAIGLTNTWDLNSHWLGADGAHKDLTQVGDVQLTSPPADAGLLNPNGAPLAKTLDFLLYFDPGMEALGAYYYRLSVVESDTSGNPAGGASPQPIANPVSWSYFETIGGITTIPSQTLGPNNVNGVPALYQIPYNADREWLGDQFHMYLDTTTLPNTFSSTGQGNGQFLLVLEVFDKNGKRLVPQSATGLGPNDVATAFNFVRLLSGGNPGTTSNVPFKSLTHMIWVDNRFVVGEVDYFATVVNGVTTQSSDECQFLTAPGGGLFEVGYRAYHRVLGDAAPAPHPSRTFMNSFSLDWEEGLNGPSGVLDSGGDIDKPITRDGGPPAVSPGVTFNTLLGNQTACAFAITLHVFGKHNNGFGRISDYDVEVPVAVALSKM